MFKEKMGIRDRLFLAGTLLLGGCAPILNKPVFDQEPQNCNYPATIEPPCKSFNQDEPYSTNTPSTPEYKSCNNKSRITVLNYSGSYVYIFMDRQGLKNENMFNYLTVPIGSPKEPTTKVFFVCNGLYSTTVWRCDGERISGSTLLNNNIKIKIPPCPGK